MACTYIVIGLALLLPFDCGLLWVNLTNEADWTPLKKHIISLGESQIVISAYHPK